MVAGRYRVDRIVGQWGMGIVVAATHLKLGGQVALKFLLPDEGGGGRDDLLAARFLREAQLAVRIRSEHVGRVLDVGTNESGDPYLVMELLDGEDLGAVLRRRGALPVVEAVDYVLQACEAIAEAHEHGIIHRDLKPANLFAVRGADGWPLIKVLDFGISKQPRTARGTTDESLPADTDVLGSPLYMSPEQIENPRAVDARSDVWSLGAILYRMLTGRSPFQADAGTTFTQILSRSPAPLRDLRPELPPGLDGLVMRCLERDLAQRVPSIETLAQGLLPFAPHRPRGRGWQKADSTRSEMARKSERSGDRPSGAVPSCRPGQVIGERFEIESQAGSGGMGVVYRARDLRSGAPVAVKVLHDRRGEQEARFAREAQALARLDHPAVVRYVAQGATPEGDAFLAMEWLEGEPLAKRLSRNRLSVHEAIALAFRLADALAAAHRAGMVHRDVKPSNVMLCGGELTRAKLVDFGIARMFDRTKLTETGAMLGTIGYMAPEQARGEREIDARADVFALGAVLFKCLAGRALFEGDEPLAILLRQTTEDAPRLSTVLHGVPPALDDLVARMLARSPAERLPDAVVLLDELRRLGYTPPGPALLIMATGPRALSDAPTAVEPRAPILAPRPEAATTARRTVWRNLAIAGAGMALLGTVAAVGAALGLSQAAPSFSCAAERCEPLVFSNPTAVDLTELIPEVRAIVTEIDRSAELTVATGHLKNGLIDTTKDGVMLQFRMSPASAKQGRGWLIVGVIRGLVSMSWVDRTVDSKSLPALPDPVCPGPKIFAAAKARGASSTAAGLFVSYMQGASGPQWHLIGSSLPSKMHQVSVRDATCEAL